MDATPSTDTEGRLVGTDVHQPGNAADALEQSSTLLAATMLSATMHVLQRSPPA